MKIIQDFKCFSLDDISINNKKYIDFELTKYQQTKWKFLKERIYFIESSLHWNMILFYLYNNIENTNKDIEFNIKHKYDKYYTLSIEFIKINKELESILFTFFYYDIHNNDKIKNEINNNTKSKLITYKWNNIYMNIIEKKIEKEHKYYNKKNFIILEK